MFERLEERARRVAEARAARRRGEIAQRLAAQLPRGIRADAGEEGVRLTGRGLTRRTALDPSLRALFGSLG